MMNLSGKELAPIIANGQLVSLVSSFYRFKRTIFGADDPNPKTQIATLPILHANISKATVLQLVKEAILKSLPTSKVNIICVL